MNCEIGGHYIEELVQAPNPAVLMN
jgi:hypothetical protein